MSPSVALPPDIAAHCRVVDISAEGLDDARSRGPVAYHVMSPMQDPYGVELVVPRLIERADALVMVAYDLIPFLFADPYLMRDNSMEHHVGRLRLVKTADLLLAISECTRLDFIDHLGVDPDRIVNIGTGVSEFFEPPQPGSDPLTFARSMVPAIRGPFVMSVPAFEWRKNADNLIRAYARVDPQLRMRLQLVLACAVPAHGIPVWRRIAADCGLREDELVITGYVEDPTLRALYQATQLMVFPSLYEGFGLPVAEAARCGAVCISSDRGSLPEVLLDPRSTFDPTDIDEIARSIERGLTDQVLRGELRAAAARSAVVHTWDSVARRALDAYARLDVLTRHTRRSSRARRARVAVVSPMPPVASGVAVYTSRVLEHLDRSRYEIDLYAESIPLGSWPPSTTADRVLPVAALGVTTNPYDYDAIVYCLGSSQFHVDTLDRAMLYPGIVWTHDANLMGLYLEWAERRQFEERYGWRAERRIVSVKAILQGEADGAYGEFYPASVFDDCSTYDDYVRSGVTFAARTVANAKRLIVNSNLARELMTEDLGRAIGHDRPPLAIDVIPHAVPARETLQLGDTKADAEPLVVALGFCVRRKRPHVIVEAIAQIDRQVQIVFVGSCAPDLAAELFDLAGRLGVTVTITGYVSPLEYGEWLRRAWCCVQLRETDFGESTGTVHDAIAAGLPAITSVQSCRELPADVVVNVAASIAARELSSEIRQVLFDERQRARMHEAMRAYGRQWTFVAVAEALDASIDLAVADASRSMLVR